MLHDFRHRHAGPLARVSARVPWVQSDLRNKIRVGLQGLIFLKANGKVTATGSSHPPSGGAKPQCVLEEARVDAGGGHSRAQDAQKERPRGVRTWVCDCITRTLRQCSQTWPSFAREGG